VWSGEKKGGGFLIHRRERKTEEGGKGGGRKKHHVQRKKGLQGRKKRDDGLSHDAGNTRSEKKKSAELVDKKEKEREGIDTKRSSPYSKSYKSETSVEGKDYRPATQNKTRKEHHLV